MTKALHFLLLLILVVMMSCAKKPDTTTIPAGFDLFRTDPETTFFNFEKMPIPAGFFAADSAPFTGTVKFSGGILPSSHFKGRELTQVDTIVRREQPVTLSSTYPASNKVSVEMTGLSLFSEHPIQVQVGKQMELWDVQVDLSARRPSKGVMTITKTDAYGGTFESQLTVYPVFRFTRVSDAQERILDTGALEMTEDMRERFTLRASQVSWRHAAPQGALVIEGVNDNFFLGGGAQARFKESSDVCSHGAGGGTSEPPPLSCTVTATRGTTVARFSASGRTSPGATVTIHSVEGNCHPASTLDEFLPGTTSDKSGNYRFGPVSTFPSTTPGIGKPVLVKVQKGGESAFCCTTVVAQN
jgi:hypothetical protein